MDKVIFRKFIGGNIIALFPEILSDAHFHTCSSYEHVGQHGSADYNHVIQKTKPAVEKEYKDLYNELTKRGYKLKVIKRASYKMVKVRHQAVMGKALWGSK